VNVHRMRQIEWRSPRRGGWLSWLAFLLGVGLAAPSARPGLAAPPPHAEATEAMAADRLDEARALLEAPAAAGDAEALHLLGVVAVRQDRPDDALALLERAAASRPDSAETHYWLGVALDDKRRTVSRIFQLEWARRMREAWERAVGIDPDHASAHDALVHFHAEAPKIAGGDPAKARYHARELARLRPVDGNLRLASLQRADGDLVATAESLELARNSGGGAHLVGVVISLLVEAG